MKKWVIIALLIMVVMVPIIWWSIQASVPSGIYPVKHGGSLVLEYEDNSSMVEFRLPVKWVKTYPWDDLPVLEEINLLDNEGDTIASIVGDYTLWIIPEQNKWNKRLVDGEIEFFINGEQVKEDGGMTATPKSNSIKGTYIPSQLKFAFENETYTFSLENSYKLYLIPLLNNDSTTSWRVERLMPLHEHGTFTTKGYLVDLIGSKGATLEDILFWLPGMTVDYYNGKALYSYDVDINQFLNENDTFQGEQLNLPLKLESNHLLLYFPITKEIRSQVKNSFVHFIPYFKFSGEDGNVYYNGGMGSIGPLDNYDN